MSDGKIGRALGLGSIALGMAMSAGCIEVRIGCTEGLVIDGNRCVAAIDAGPTDVVGTMDRTVPKDVAGPTDAERSDGVGGDQGAVDASACPTGATRCAGACVLLTSDAAHCGACGNACAAGQSCSAGVCGTVCPMGTSLCGTTCVALGGACTSGGSGGCETAGMIVCTAGRAVCSAAPRTSGACGVPFNGVCGAAGVCACAMGTHNCSGSCVSDTAVGSCGAACTACPVPSGGSATCVGGVCGSACPAGTSACSGACVALTTGTNCGACGVACGAGQMCSGGACVPFTGTCPAGMAYIPGGTFMMGDAVSVNAQPPHMVTLSAYCMDLTEVTVAAYRGCTAPGCTVPRTGGSFNWGVAGRDNHPINGVDWNQSRAYCQSLGRDLPTEAQWEYAARGTDGRIYPWGNAAPASQLCWEAVGAPRTSTCAVQSFPSGNSPFGLFDMAGNVWEWTLDFYSTYTTATATDPTGPTSGTNRVFRGGSWLNGADAVTASVRDSRIQSNSAINFGFRCARPTGSLRCGDGVVGTGETCDDGNTVSGDGCSATCQSEATCSSLTMATRGGYAEVADAAPLRLATGTFTIEGWVFGQDYAGSCNNVIVAKRGMASMSGWFLSVAGSGCGAISGRLYYSQSGGGDPQLQASVAAPIGRWYHVAVTRDAVTGTVTLWQDGISVGSMVMPAPSATSTAPLRIGLDSSGNGYPWLGSFDAMRISNTARYTARFTPPSVLSSDASTIALWNFNETSGAALDGSGNGNHAALLSGATRSNVCRSPTYSDAVTASRPIAWWPLDETSGTTVRDVVGGRVATLAAGAIVSMGQSGLSGSGTSVRIVSGGGFRLPYDRTLALSVFSTEFIMTTPGCAAGSFCAPVAFRTTNPLASPVCGGWTFFRSGASDTAPFYVQISNGSCPWGAVSTSSLTVVPDNTRHHIAFTSDSSLRQLYVDGIAVASTPSSASYAGAATDSSFAMGEIGNGNGVFTGGTIDEVAVYDRSLAASEIAAHFAAIR